MTIVTLSPPEHALSAAHIQIFYPLLSLILRGLQDRHPLFYGNRQRETVTRPRALARTGSEGEKGTSWA